MIEPELTEDDLPRDDDQDSTNLAPDSSSSFPVKAETVSPTPIPTPILIPIPIPRTTTRTSTSKKPNAKALAAKRKGLQSMDEFDGTRLSASRIGNMPEHTHRSIVFSVGTETVIPTAQFKTDSTGRPVKVTVPVVYFEDGLDCVPNKTQLAALEGSGQSKRQPPAWAGLTMTTVATWNEKRSRWERSICAVEAL